MGELRTVSTPVLDIGYETSGDPDGPPVVLLHGFPYDIRAFDRVADRLADGGNRVIVPYLRGFGPTRFRSSAMPRSGQQAALGSDLIDLLDALEIPHAVVGGYDWGGRAACVAAVLIPDRIAGLVSVGGYNIQNLAAAGQPSRPSFERTYWYQYYFHSERGRAGLAQYREELCELLWTTWSPSWTQASTEFARSAPSLHNADFVEVVIHSYRHRFGLVAGDPRYDDVEAVLATTPAIRVPTVVIDPGSDGILAPATNGDREQFTGPFERIYLPAAGHNVPQEAPEAFFDAIVRVSALAG
jgi:pimeloyl-ACP methyl ester carboxylesterase